MSTMKKAIANIILLFFAHHVFAQNSLKVIVNDEKTNEHLFGAVVIMDNGKAGAKTDANGFAEVKNIDDGKHLFVFQYTGYSKLSKTYTFPLKNDKVIEINLISESNDMEEVVVSSTRTNAHIQDIATRIEVLGSEETEEESAIKPGNVASLLGDISIVHIQQTSSVNGNAVARMQGLDGKYTLLLHDGLPLYEGFSGSFGILQIPPLDLKQIELVKGSVSTLYGGGAIGGMINFISKEPTDSGETSFTLNNSTLGESNANVFLSRKLKKFGFTLFGGYTHQIPVDIDNNGFSVVPQLDNVLIHPKFFFYISPKTKLTVGFSGMYENRTGGDITAILHQSDSIHHYYESVKSYRTSADVIFTHKLTKGNEFNFKYTAGLFNRNNTQSGYVFNGQQVTSFSEISYLIKARRHKIILGLNHVGDYFSITKTDSTRLQNYSYNTAGLFVQDDWDITDKFTCESGLRTDFHNKFGSFVLPRMALLYKFTNTFSARLSSGLGYKTPNIFTQQTLAGSFQNLSPIDNTVSAERSTGVNFDINYKFILFDGVSVSLNQAFYYTNISNPISVDTTGGRVSLINIPAYVDSRGTDTYIRIKADELELYFGYNHTISINKYSGAEVYLPFSPQDKFSNTIVYDIEGKWRFGFEDSYISNQYKDNGIKVRDFWLLAAMVEKSFKYFSIVANCENLLDVRQTRFERIVNQPYNNPSFNPIWAPIDGRVLNVALRIKL